jgi:hypothetical protein
MHGIPLGVLIRVFMQAFAGTPQSENDLIRKVTKWPLSGRGFSAGSRDRERGKNG